MTSCIIKRRSALLACLSGLAVSAIALPSQGAVLVSHTFDGNAGTNLSGTSVDMVDSAITNAGGSASWSADSSYKADGSYTTSLGKALVNLGSYIEDAQGTETGKFVLTATIDEPTAGAWVSVGFLNTTNTGTNFVNGHGAATSVNRPAGSIGSDHYTGPGVGTTYDAGELDGTVTFTTTVDFTPASGYNGTSNYGTVTFANSVNGNTYTYTYTQDFTWAAVGFTKGSDTTAGGGLVSISLSQVPEPASLSLLALGGLLLRRRSRLA